MLVWKIDKQPSELNRSSFTFFEMSLTEFSALKLSSAWQNPVTRFGFVISEMEKKGQTKFFTKWLQIKLFASLGFSIKRVNFSFNEFWRRSLFNLKLNNSIDESLRQTHSTWVNRGKHASICRCANIWAFSINPNRFSNEWASSIVCFRTFVMANCRTLQGSN